MIARHITSMDTEYMPTLAIKAESEVDDFKIEHVPLETINFNISDTTKPESNLFLQLENSETIGKLVLEHYHSSPAFSQPDYKSPTSFLTTNDAQQKTETKSDIGQMNGIVYEGWNVKNEELDIKEEDLEQIGTSILPAGLSQHMPIHTFDESHPRDHQTVLESNSRNQLPGTFHGQSLTEYHFRHNINSHEKFGLFKCCCQYKFKCIKCKYQASYKSNLNTHLPQRMKLEDDKRFKCNDCDYRTIRKDTLRIHTVQHMNSDECKKFKCNDCDYRTIVKGRLKTHMLRHINSEAVKQFKCNDCDFQTVHKGNLRTHMLRHINSEDVKKFKCNDCDYRTFHKCTLNTHMLQHINSEDVKKFKCNDCDFQTIHKSNLRTHMLRHMNSADVKKFKCNDCDYRTFHKSHLQTHMLQHINSEQVRKFKCDQCKFETIYNKSFKRHLLRHMNPNKV